MAAQGDLITVIGRGHSGTRLLSDTLHESGVFMGTRNESGDTVPPEQMYDACRLVARNVRWTGGLSWDFSRLHEMPIDPDFEDLVRAYLAQVLASTATHRGWKLPETTLAYPWIVRMFPEAKYVQIVRDPRDGLLKSHLTDDLERCSVHCAEADNPLDRRVASWKYQHEIVKATPQPKHFLSLRFEDLVLDNDAALRQLEEFLGFPLARIAVDGTRVGQWRADPRLVPHVQPLAPEMSAMGYA